MKQNRVRSLVVFAAACAVVAGPGLTTPAFAAEASVNAACSWSVSALPLPTGQTAATVIGDDGGRLVLGTMWTGFGSWGPRPVGDVLWNDGALARTAPQNQSWNAVNSSGTIAGSVGLDSQPARIAANGTVQTLPVSSSWTRARTESINSRGDIAGWAETPLSNGSSAAFVVVWPADAPSTYRVLPRPFQGYAAVTSGSTQIDDQGRVAAAISAASSSARGYVWSQQTAAPRLLEAPAGETSVVDINNGQVLGNRSDLVQGSYVRVLAVWNDQGQITRTVPVAVGSAAASLSTEGAIGGRNYVGGEYLPTIWNGTTQTALPRDPATAPPRYSYRWSVDAIRTGGTVAAGTLTQSIPEDGQTKGYKPVIWRCA